MMPKKTRNYDLFKIKQIYVISLKGILKNYWDDLYFSLLEN